MLCCTPRSNIWCQMMSSHCFSGCRQIKVGWALLLCVKIFNIGTCQFTVAEVAVNPDLIWCPRPGCETVCIVSQNSDKPAKKKLFGFIPISGSRKNQVVTCSDCNFSFCSRCRTSWHRGAPCPTAKMDASGEQQNINVRRCPFSLFLNGILRAKLI